MKKSSYPLPMIGSVAMLVASLSVLPTLADTKQAGWKTWIVKPNESYLTDVPPDSVDTKAEINVMQSGQNTLDEDRIVAIHYWQAGSSNYRWMQLILDRYAKGPPSPNKSRGIALLNVAIYDAIALASNAKKHYKRPRPMGIETHIPVPKTSSYPSARAAADAAAAGVLSYLFPEETKIFATAAQSAANSRVDAGVNFPSDIAAGMRLGQTVADQIISYAMSDNSDSKWAGERPVGPDKLKGDVFVYPTVGSWKTWAITSVDDYLPPPPPAIDSPEMAAELTELKNIERTLPVAMNGWMNHSVTRAYHWWYERIATAIFENNRQNDIAHSAHAYASVSVANHDAIIACFNAKYTYWMIRPAQLDNTVPTLFPSPPHPSYPAAHSCSSESYATAISHYFPAHAAAVEVAAEKAGMSRLQAGIHYPSDKRAGETLGHQVTEDVIQFAQALAAQ